MTSMVCACEGIKLIDEAKTARWQRAPVRPILKENSLHLWRVNLEKICNISGSLKILSADERARCMRLISAEKQRAFASARVALRIILSRYLGLLPEEIQFGYSRLGKPYLVYPSLSEDIQFNLSHSGRWMVLGICKRSNVGVDVEKIRLVNQNWALGQLFSAEERAYISSAPKNKQNTAFIAAWTIKEAAAKASGGGLACMNQSKYLPLESEEMLSKNGFVKFWEEPFWFIHFIPVNGYLSTAAVESIDEPEVHFYEFS